MKENIYELSFARKKARKHAIVKVCLILILFFISMNLIFALVIMPVQQKTISMEPNILRGSLLISTPILQKTRRGELVLISSKNHKREYVKEILDLFCGFWTFQKFRPFSRSQKMNDLSFIRRVVALPGDSIYMKDFILYIKPKDERHFLTEFELTQIPYNVDITTQPNEWDVNLGVQGSFKEFTLGTNEYFVLSDNRLSSIDSRLWGTVSGNDISGKILCTYFPLNKIKIY